MICFASFTNLSAVAASIGGATEYDLCKAASSAPLLDTILFLLVSVLKNLESKAGVRANARDRYPVQQQKRPPVSKTQREV
jgi:hypothetical protein